MSFRVRQTHAVINMPLKPKPDVVPKKKNDDVDDVDGDDDQKVAVAPAAPSDSSRTKASPASFTVRPNFGGKSDYY